MTAAEVIARELADARGYVSWRGFTNQAEYILAALRGAGFAVVPREATDAMVNAALDWQEGPAYSKVVGAVHFEKSQAGMAALYRAMVAAAEPREGGE